MPHPWGPSRGPSLPRSAGTHDGVSSCPAKATREKEGPIKVIEKIDLRGKLSLFDERWSPRIVGEVNDAYVKLVKLQGEFVWHAPEGGGELFLVLQGRLTMRFRDGETVLGPGEMIIVPRGVEHMPVAS